MDLYFVIAVQMWVMNILVMSFAGARLQTSSILLKLAELKEARDALYLSIQKLEKVDNELNAIKGTAAKFVLSFMSR